MTSLPVPEGLSPRSAALWQELTERHRFEPHELVAFRRALEWFDVSDALLAKMADVADREAAAMVKLAMDAATCALRHWRTLKFVDAAQPARRPGRPSDDNWSTKRKLQKVV